MAEQRKSYEPEELLAFSEERALQWILDSARPDWDILKRHSDFNEKWITLFLQRTTPIAKHAVLDIYRDPELRRRYRVRLAMMRCRSTPPSIAMNLATALRWVDLFQSLRLPHLSGAVRKRIIDRLMEVLPRLALGEKIALARQAPRPLIRSLRLLPERPVIKALLNNYHFTYEDAMFLANFPEIKPGPLEELALSTRWTQFPEVRAALARNNRTPRAVTTPLVKGMSDHQLRLLLRDPKAPLFAKQIARRVLETRDQNKNDPAGGRSHKKRKGRTRIL